MSGPVQAFEQYPKLAFWIERLANSRIEGFSHASWCAFLAELNTALADRLEEREGWVMVPREAMPAMLEQAAFNMCAEYGVDFVKPLGQFVKDAYAELVAAAAALPTPPTRTPG